MLFRSSSPRSDEHLICHTRLTPILISQTEYSYLTPHTAESSRVLQTTPHPHYHLNCIFYIFRSTCNCSVWGWLQQDKRRRRSLYQPFGRNESFSKLFRCYSPLIASENRVVKWTIRIPHICYFWIHVFSLSSMIGPIFFSNKHGNHKNLSNTCKTVLILGEQAIRKCGFGVQTYKHFGSWRM